MGAPARIGLGVAIAAVPLAAITAVTGIAAGKVDAAVAKAGAATSSSTALPAGCTTLHPRLTLLDTEQAGHRYTVTARQDIDVCLSPGQAPDVRGGSGRGEAASSDPNVRIALAKPKNLIGGVRCRRLPAPCITVRTRIGGTAYGPLGRELGAAHAWVITEVGADGATATRADIGRD